ncbi:hypothetical protein NSMS1_60570 (plasmid) [Nostoc sp. MS1]|nr:hypothetical protein NSMS1_60570 [Nostoc sp. MS1]
MPFKALQLLGYILNTIGQTKINTSEKTTSTMYSVTELSRPGLKIRRNDINNLDQVVSLYTSASSTNQFATKEGSSY